MSKYDFTSLSDFDFEILTRDLLQCELQLTLESFKNGRDNGIDLRYSRRKKNEIIIQCKHYSGSGYSQLKQAVNKEVEKVRKLNPKRYILVTSLGLTPANKDELLETLKPYCKTTGDIFGKDDLNNLLTKFTEIEKKNFKLWLTSATVLDKILNNSIYNNSEIQKENIITKLKNYVQNESYKVAKDILAKQNYCVISGIPGIGKTTLAEILLVDYLSRDYQIVKVSHSISEAFDVYHSSKKQVFYYDDFLGQTNLTEKLRKNEDQLLLDFIEAVRRSKNTKFILTTREYILNQAKTTYEKLERSKFDIRKCIVDLSDYTKFDRAKILYNHLHFSNLPLEYKRELVKNRNYWQVINHDNYSPRIIEWMTDLTRNPDLTTKNYFVTFLSNLNNPSSLWTHAFERQISKAAQHILIIMVSLPPEVTLADLEKAFDEFHNLRSDKYRTSFKSTDFRDALKEVESTFVRIFRHGDETLVSFHNPSVRDFMENYLKANVGELKDLLDSTIFFYQCAVIWGIRKKIDKDSPRLVLDFISNFVDSIARTINSKDVLYEKLPNGRLITKHTPFEERVSFVIDVAEEQNCQKIIELLDRLITDQIERIQKRELSYESLLSMLRKISRSTVESSMEQSKLLDLRRLSKDNYTNRYSEVEDFLYVASLSEIFPSDFSVDEIAELREEFIEFYEGNYDMVLGEGDPTILRQYADVVEEITAYLEINSLEPDYEVFREEADNIEREHEPDDDDYWDYRGSDNSDDSEDKQIEMMFDLI
ncbi:restriction endonuclease [Tumebacillus sp. BK434]|uniref:nSTAND3 domain-containing NTPase n=1 Tax=Tumebacillus sp. BK434 TaxID=2512169 RepID=UPI001051DCC0|nr:restriction endonuclease [Tumebacillus sp. BK434]TCP55500.1 restriction endonuclease [Tumebacillus sp. BK434]